MRARGLRWLNELLGHVSLIPFAAPFRYLRHTHFEHHAHANNPVLDPDYDVHAENRFEFFRQSLMRMQPGDEEGQQAYPAALKRIGKEHLVLEALAVRGVYLLVLFAAAWSGYAIEAALAVVGAHFAVSGVYPLLPKLEAASSGPRHRALPRYVGFSQHPWQPRFFGYAVPHRPSSVPRIPLMQTPAAYRELRPILERQGCDLGKL